MQRQMDRKVFSVLEGLKRWFPCSHWIFPSSCVWSIFSEVFLEMCQTDRRMVSVLLLLDRLALHSVHSNSAGRESDLP